MYSATPPEAIDAVDVAEIDERIGEIEMRDIGGHRTGDKRGDERIGHGLGHAIERGVVDDVAELPVEARALRMRAPGGIEAHDAAFAIDDQKPPADMDRGGRQHAPAFDERELRRAAADVDIEDAAALLARSQRRTRAVGGEHRFHVMAGGGADEIAARFGEHRGDCLGVLAAERLAGEDHGAGVDVLRLRAPRRDRRPR